MRRYPGEAIRMLHHCLRRGSLNSFGWSKKLLSDAFETSLESQLERERHGLLSSAAVIPTAGKA